MKTLAVFFFYWIFILNHASTFKAALNRINSNDTKFIMDNSFNKELSSFESKYIIHLKKLKKFGTVSFQSDTIKLIQLTIKQQILRNIKLGDYYLYNKIPKNKIAFEKYNQALNFSLELNNSILISECSKKVLFLIFKSRKNLSFLRKYLDIFKKNILSDNDKAIFEYFNVISNYNNLSIIQNIKNLKIGLKTAIKSKNNLQISKYLQLEGILYRKTSFSNKELTLYFEALDYIKNEKLFLYEIEKFGLYTNIASCYFENNDINLALTFYDKANKIEIPIYRNIEKIKHNDLLAKNLYKKKQYKLAYKYLTKANQYRLKFNENDKDIALNDIYTKYKTAEIEKENDKQQFLLLLACIFILLGGIITYLNLKSSRRKRLLAEQQKEIEKQKNLTLLKEQEINTINAMINGQEKERIRIAEDLHDNIGSVLATLKLHFENLKLNREKKHFNQDDLYDKTEKLIDETYLKVRSIAHAKNAGVIANKGLLVAVKIMAEKISDANKIHIDVIDYGLNKRLENNLEITLFRLIQELITNIIKHANATEATINISLFDKILNIIIEDNGKGFNYNKTTLKEGMGINSIQTRIKYLKGTFDVDSTIGKGTSIIMNIPII